MARVLCNLMRVGDELERLVQQLLAGQTWRLLRELGAVVSVEMGDHLRDCGGEASTTLSVDRLLDGGGSIILSSCGGLVAGNAAHFVDASMQVADCRFYQEDREP